MATSALKARPERGPRPLDATTYEKALAGIAILLVVMVAGALVRGLVANELWRASAIVWLHIATIVTALVLTPVMLLRRRGDRPHRVLGYVWVLSMAVTALASFWVKTINPGSFSLIHILSAWTLIQLPIIVWTARKHRHGAHRRSVRGMVLGALLIAGFFTFPAGRLMGHWLFG